MMYKQRRDNYLKQVSQFSLSLFFSGHAPQKSNDQNYAFSVNRNFYYLTGIDQQHVVLLLAKGENTTKSYLFLEENDPVKVLWDGAGLDMDQASKLSEIEFSDIKNITTLDATISSLLSTSRKAQFGIIEHMYLDLERQHEKALDTTAIRFSHDIKHMYPGLIIKSNQMILAQLRMVKDANEIEIVKKAIAITEKGLKRILESIEPGYGEYEVEAEYNYVLNLHRVSPSFDTIAASGKNATILHYVENASKINNNDLVLFDLGVDYEHYCSDITRTYPANGTFTDRQKAVYEVVLEANKKTIAWLKPGVTFQEFNDYGKNILIAGAKKLGLIKEDAEISTYYYHSLGHYLGLDVHDVGNYSLPIPEGALITVEPGLYIASEGIGIRIEDDVVVTKDGALNLSASIIKEIDEIEKFMK